jgi:hypothetical protein
MSATTPMALPTKRGHPHCVTEHSWWPSRMHTLAQATKMSRAASGCCCRCGYLKHQIVSLAGQQWVLHWQHWC